MSGQAFFIFAAIVIVLMVIVVTIRTGGSAAGQRNCPHCGELQPGAAKFCRRCGKPLN
jgi:hypothetical protein